MLAAIHMPPLGFIDMGFRAQRRFYARYAWQNEDLARTG
jgi:hypothetical protein